MPVRVYKPRGEDGRLPVVVFFHGGGWVVCDLDSHDDICRAVTTASMAGMPMAAARTVAEAETASESVRMRSSSASASTMS